MVGPFTGFCLLILATLRFGALIFFFLLPPLGDKALSFGLFLAALRLRLVLSALRFRCFAFALRLVCDARPTFDVSLSPFVLDARLVLRPAPRPDRREPAQCPPGVNPMPGNRATVATSFSRLRSSGGVKASSQCTVSR